MRRLALALSLILLALPAYAVQPDEVLDDPVLEERARELSQGLRCLVCRNENIDDSNAPLARDLRLLVRERLVAGDSDAQALDFIVARYGEYVLLKPPLKGSTLLLYAAGPLMLLLAAIGATVYLRRRATAQPVTEAGLDADEEARLREILKD
ncbi:cytochrome c-type biogenesis protein CcmH [Roseovarius faecimaris]|uniref:Cytochrome c-type biogenesis protein n=1 Tax=Roseovarius faecimaris TaxID=2494550 RepID=A0A6I6IQF3_9RHOB|nr:cytochrome c-type biogenesis protein [Roseovarius faecimaris]QGX98091.1 cytochrome c-type biogenesis protein CcmH [Roseovarius faecimaris]